MNIFENVDEYFNNKIISVVCNGSSLLKNDYSKDIDDSDIVIRINIGAINYKNYKQLGKKMDVFATNAYFDTNAELVSNFLKSIDKNKIILTTRPLFNNIKTRCAIADTRFIKIYNSIINNIIEIKEDILLKNNLNGFNNFSSGLTIILFLLEFNIREIKIFGMDFFKSDYYYNSKVPINPHRPDIEKKIIDDLIIIDKIKLYK
jgi:hypothetical protein